jgi:predicted ATP-dependent protease
LTTRLRDLGDVMTEASFWADRRGHDLVQADDVRQALQQRRRRSDLLEQQVREQILEGTMVVQTEGAALGQVNALAVVQLGDLAFGRTIRTTAAVGVGRGLVRSIEREVRLADPSHGKGVLALAGYLATRYGQEHVLALGATLTLEQVYEPVVGDSSMLAELLALLSALAGRPASQAVAVTGAVDQHGAVQAVGGVNDKVEAFFHLCAARGLREGQGVLLPAGNARHLMLDEAVIEAVAQGRFQIWAVATVDEAMALVFGVPAAEVHDEVAARLARFAHIRQEDGHLPG